MDTQYTRVINKDTITLLSQELSLQSWDDILNLYDANQAYDLFLNKFIAMFNKHCPIEKCNDLNMSIVKNIIAPIVKPLNHMCNVSFNT